MIKPIYSIRDLKVGFTQVVVDDNDETAKRGFCMAICHDHGLRGFASADFQLYKVGSFDTQTGVITCDSIPVLLMDGQEAIVAHSSVNKE